MAQQTTTYKHTLYPPLVFGATLLCTENTTHAIISYINVTTGIQFIRLLARHHEGIRHEADPEGNGKREYWHPAFVRAASALLLKDYRKCGVIVG